MFTPHALNEESAMSLRLNSTSGFGQDKTLHHGEAVLESKP